MKRFKRYRDYGFFDQDIRLSKLSQLGTALEKLKSGIDFKQTIKGSRWQTALRLHFALQDFDFAVILQSLVQPSRIPNQ